MRHVRALKSLISAPQHWTPVRLIHPRYCSNVAKTATTPKGRSLDKIKTQISSGPSFEDFIRGVSVKTDGDGELSDRHAYLSEDLEMASSRKGWFASLKANKSILMCGTNANLCITVYFETYGCKMNVNDTEIAWSILQRKGYQRTEDLQEVQEISSVQLEHDSCHVVD